jgi:AmiR/NasT family two-component response regulator
MDGSDFDEEVWALPQLERVMSSEGSRVDGCDVIDQATGVTMFRRRCTRIEALGFLLDRAAQEDRDLNDVAWRIVDSLTFSNLAPQPED